MFTPQLPCFLCSFHHLLNLQMLPAGLPSPPALFPPTFWLHQSQVVSLTHTWARLFTCSGSFTVFFHDADETDLLAAWIQSCPPACSQPLFHPTPGCKQAQAPTQHCTGSTLALLPGKSSVFTKAPAPFTTYCLAHVNSS